MSCTCVCLVVVELASACQTAGESGLEVLSSLEKGQSLEFCHYFHQNILLCVYSSLSIRVTGSCVSCFFCHNLQTGGSTKSEVEKSAEKIRQLIKLAEDLVPKMVDVKEKEIGDLLENEMHSTTSAIELAAKKIEVSYW